jgi:hypothetical protein
MAALSPSFQWTEAREDFVSFQPDSDSRETW